MKAIPWDIQSLRRGGTVENRQDSFHRFPQIRAYPAPVTALIEQFQTAVLEAPDH
jgi:hypothetical protein